MMKFFPPLAVLPPGWENNPGSTEATIAGMGGMQNCIANGSLGSLRPLSREEIEAYQNQQAFGMMNVYPQPTTMGRNRRLERVANGG